METNEFMKKILIVSYMFAPRAGIGAIRWTKIAKYLQQHNVYADVLTLEETSDQDELLARDAAALKGNFFRVSHSDSVFMPNAAAKAPYRGPLEPSVKGVANRLKRSRAVMRLRRLMNKKKVEEGKWKNYRQGEDFCNQAIKYIRENNIRPDEYDDVIVSFGPVGDALLALKIKELWPKTRLIMDFRDPMNNFMQSRRMNEKYEQIQDRLCEVADKVIAVGNNGYADKIFKPEDKSRLHVITNGYDVEDMQEIEAHQDGKFSFAFTGSLYDGIRDMSALFEVLAELINDGVIDRKDVLIKHAGGDFLKLMAQAQRYGLGDVLNDSGLITRRKCLELQRSSRILVFTSWNFKGRECNLNAKLFEYMLMDRPIIGIATGDVSHSEARKIVEACNIGMVYEHGDKKASRAALYDFLKADYERYKQGLDSLYEPDRNETCKYDYRNIALQVAEIL